jgi:ketosteroid isomerase-like protein
VEKRSEALERNPAVATVRRGWEAWIRGDVVALFAEYAPDIVWDMSYFREWPESAYRGHDGVRRFLDEWLAVWADYEAGLDQLLLAPDGRVVALAWQRGKGRVSGIAMEMQWAQVTTVRNERVARIDNYEDRAEALRDAGLTE